MKQYGRRLNHDVNLECRNSKIPGCIKVIIIFKTKYLFYNTCKWVWNFCNECLLHSELGNQKNLLMNIFLESKKDISKMENLLKILTDPSKR